MTAKLFILRPVHAGLKAENSTQLYSPLEETKTVQNGTELRHLTLTLGRWHAINSIYLSKGSSIARVRRYNRDEELLTINTLTTLKLWLTSGRGGLVRIMGL